MLNSLDRVAASKAFLASVLESLVFVSRRILASLEGEAVSLLNGKAAAEGGANTNTDAAVKALIQDQMKRAWEELSSGRLKVEGRAAGAHLAKTFADLHKLRPGILCPFIDHSQFANELRAMF